MHLASLNIIGRIGLVWHLFGLVWHAFTTATNRESMVTAEVAHLAAHGTRRGDRTTAPAVRNQIDGCI